MAASIRLTDYDIDIDRGFVPSSDPLVRLPPRFEPWDLLVERLPLLIMSGHLRAAIGELPLLDAAKLESDAEQRRALLVLAGLAGAWLASRTDERVIPRQIAVPLAFVAAALGVPPVTAHATVVLCNWRRIDVDRPLGLDNVDTLLSFRGSIDEKWFFLSTMGVELAGAPLLRCLVEAVDAAAASDEARLCGALQAIAAGIDAVATAFARVRECCDPYIFFSQVRPFIAGYAAPGVTFEAVEDAPVALSGGSAAQSSLLQAIDATLGIAHKHTLTNGFLQSMRAYMPPKHRSFLAEIGARSRVREVVVRQGVGKDLRRTYDEAVGALDVLRRRHIGLATEYIAKQMPPGVAGVGTGGTQFEDFLRQARVETVQSKVGQST